LFDTEKQAQDTQDVGKMVRRDLKGSFWPEVRQRMYEKAVELYMFDHPETQNKPEPEELSEGGYMHTAKVLVLREIRFENKPKLRMKER
jgi:hypothetical protein